MDGRFSVDGMCAGSRGASSRVKRSAKLLADASRAFRGPVSPKSSTAVAITDVCCRTRFSTMPFGTHGETMSDGTRRPRRSNVNAGTWNGGSVVRIRRVLTVGIGYTSWADMVEESAVLVVGHDQHGLFEQLGISGEGIIDICNEVLSKSHILGSVL